MIKHQGEDIDFMVKFDLSLSEDIQSFDDCDEVIVRVYTNKFRPVRFSDIVRDGHIGLLRVDSTHRAGLVPASLTKLMQVGDMFCEVMMVKDGRRSVEVTYESGVHLDPAIIKEEA